ncbi:MAG: hypothetical protein JW763_02670 [candidate division Zixibacteria bacterium]|nr:hypothetical protein [candidate division Zixibacteria bacterium]
MNKIIVFCLTVVLGASAITLGKTLTEEQQQSILQNLAYVKGRGERPSAMTEAHHWSGTSSVLDAFFNREYLDESAKSATSILLARPTYLPDTFGSPGGHFLFHYTTTGPNAVYQANVDVLNGGDGIPDFVNRMAIIADSVWDKEIVEMGYPAPPTDDFYPDGGDARFDFYIRDLGDYVFGSTTPEMYVSAGDSQTVTAYMELNNDFRVQDYASRPLDAVRVTLAHEFFHVIQFGMDFSEPHVVNDMKQHYWFEMSAVWMEEQVYDHINDYYSYIPFYYALPWISIEYSSAMTLHQYGAGIFPLYLSEKYGPDIVRDIWERCRDYGPGFQTHQAMDDAIIAASGGESNLRLAFNEFAVWNYFAGERAALAPEGMGFSEGADYPALPDSVITDYSKYKLVVNNLTIRRSGRSPENLSANYANLRAVSAIPDTVRIAMYGDEDSPYNIQYAMSYIKFPRDAQSPVEVDRKVVPIRQIVFDTLGLGEDYLNVVLIPTPVSTNPNAYPGDYDYSFTVLNYVDPRGNDFYAPYGNPIVVTQESDHVTFRANAYVDTLGAKEASLEVSLYTVAGEKVRVLKSAPEFVDNIAVDWYFDNDSGTRIASGVYLALYRLVFTDGSDDVYGRHKVAVFR